MKLLQKKPKRGPQIRDDEESVPSPQPERHEPELTDPGLTDLSKRTDGWAASLQLVNSAIQARTASEIRAFVGSLSGAE